MKVESNKINSDEFTYVNEDNFLDFLEDFQEVKVSTSENHIIMPNINNSPDEPKAETNNDNEFKKFLVEKVTNDITRMDFNDLSSEFNEVSVYDNLLNNDSSDDALAISFNEFILENQTPKFNISHDMTQLYNLNNYNEIENLKKQITFENLNLEFENEKFNQPIATFKEQEVELEEKERIIDSNSFIKDENNYMLMCSINGEKNIIKTYEKLLSKNISMRLKDDINGIKTYVLRANSYKYLAKLDSNNFEIIYEL
ncbi:MAG: hypothetical protein BHW64_02075 [Candidatus Melainabacteria bacterium LEY3_CP_29_8]|nr:MAG: hypothetical protein BHW64_02075 [Candidatus Melainabacteria bacterium LEY3_CP_29_8]